MIRNKRFFSDIIRRAILIATLCAVCTTAHAASSDGCDSDSNNRITAELALCSVHAYNIGSVTNPTDATQKQLMRDIVALKTTVITQQMDKQYEYLDATIRRLKTQLEKDVLTTKLQVAGAASGSSTSSSSGGYAGTSGGTAPRRETNITLEGAQNCGASLINRSDFITCLSHNYNLIVDATNYGQTMSNDARKQLVTDFKLVRDYGQLEKSQMQPSNKDKGTYDKKCEQSNMSRTTLQDCITAHAANIGRMQQAVDQQNRQPAK